jgi:predicted Zn-dependent peptidase
MNTFEIYLQLAISVLQALLFNPRFREKYFEKLRKPLIVVRNTVNQLMPYTSEELDEYSAMVIRTEAASALNAPLTTR